MKGIGRAKTPISFTRHGKRALLLCIVCFGLALCIPTFVIVLQAYQKLKWETFHQHRLLAEELSVRIDEKLTGQLRIEEARSIGEYQFIMVEGDIQNNYILRSPLSNYPLNSELSGLLGYFQIDSEDKFSSPILPNRILESQNFGISDSELGLRMENRNTVFTILNQNQLISSRPRTKPETQVNMNNHAANPIQENVLLQDDLKAESEAAIQKEALAAINETNPSKPKEALPSHAAFDRLEQPRSKTEKLAYSENNLGRIEDLNLEKGYEKKHNIIKKKMKKKALRAPRKENIVLPKPIKNIPPNTENDNEPKDLAQNFSATQTEQRYANPPTNPDRASNTIKTQSLPQLGPSFQVKMFESEIEPFELSLLSSGHFVVYRRVWKNGERLIQGFLIDQQKAIDSFAGKTFFATTLSNTSNVAVAYRGEILSTFSAAKAYDYRSHQALKGTLLYKTHLSAPFNDIELVYTIEQLPLGAGATIIAVAAFVVILVLLMGSWVFYRLGVGQINLTNQQQDFVSSVSHELKTPLTSIRMYGEILKQGWASDEKKMEYYDYIYNESERLSRLINNVLQLAKMTRSELPIAPKALSLKQISDTISSKISSQISHAGFRTEINLPDDICDNTIMVDEDLFTQVIINLIDNAIKFSAKSEKKQVDIHFSTPAPNKVQITIRDYGPGIPNEQLRKIFTLFYRSESELTRETQGTGIGLALVSQLMKLMHGKISIQNEEPGVAASLVFPHPIEA